MPVREYKCQTCDLFFERVCFKGDNERIRCPQCDSDTVKPSPEAERFMDCSGIGTCVAALSKGPS